MQISIRLETEQDYPAIRAINLGAFPGPDEANLVDFLRSRGKATISLVAVAMGVENGSPIGHILFSPVSIKNSQAALTGLGLAPMAVLPAYQNKGIGSELVRTGLDFCQKAGADYGIVLGHTNFYPRFGFSPASGFGLENEYQVDEPFMALEFRPGALAEVSGLVKYAPEFSEIGV